MDWKKAKKEIMADWPLWLRIRHRVEVFFLRIWWRFQLKLHSLTTKGKER